MMAALVNTAGEPDELATLADLDAFLSVWVFTGRVDHDEAELAALRRLRARLAGFFDVDEQGLADGVNALLREGRALPQVVRHDQWNWHLHATDDDRPLGAALLRGLYHRHYWECPVKEGNVVVLVPADLEQQLDLAGLRSRAETLAPRLGYSLDSLIGALRPAS